MPISLPLKAFKRKENGFFSSISITVIAKSSYPKLVLKNYLYLFVCSFACIVSNLWSTVLCLSNVTRQDNPEGTKGVGQRFIVDAFVKILDENVTYASLSKRRVSLRPRDSARSSLDRIKIHGAESSFG